MTTSSLGTLRVPAWGLIPCPWRQLSGIIPTSQRPWFLITVSLQPSINSPLSQNLSICSPSSLHGDVQLLSCLWSWTLAGQAYGHWGIWEVHLGTEHDITNITQHPLPRGAGSRWVAGISIGSVTPYTALLDGFRPVGTANGKDGGFCWPLPLLQSVLLGLGLGTRWLLKAGLFGSLNLGNSVRPPVTTSEGLPDASTLLSLSYWKEAEKDHSREVFIGPNVAK